MISFERFQISWLKKAQKQLNDLEDQIKEKIFEKIDLLIKRPESLDIKKLKGYSDLYRISYGDYRVIFKVVSSSKIIIIAFVSHRRDIYEKFPGA